MTKKKAGVPAPKSVVERNIDFNLKKEDLMTILLEGRKEITEKEIAGLEDEKNKLTKQLGEQQTAFRNKIIELLKSSVKSTFIGLFAELDNGEDPVRIELNNLRKEIWFDAYGVSSIKNIAGEKMTNATYIKSKNQQVIVIYQYDVVTYKLLINLGGKIFLNKSDLFLGEVRGAESNSYSQVYQIGRQSLDLVKQAQMPEYKALEETAHLLAKVSGILSEAITDYDLFSRNQSRAKASMIKEILARDTQGKALLDNIINASKNTKLLS